MSDIPSLNPMPNADEEATKYEQAPEEVQDDTADEGEENDIDDGVDDEEAEEGDEDDGSDE